MNILIVKMSSLGDLIHVFPVVHYLQKNIPEAKIDWVVESPFAPLVRAHPFVNEVLCVETKKWRSALFKKRTWKEIGEFRKKLRKKTYDLVLDLQGNTKSAFVTALARSSNKVGFGSATVPEWPNLLVTDRKFNPPKGENIRQDYLFIGQSALGKFVSKKDGAIQLKLTSPEQHQFELIQDHLWQTKGVKVLVCPGSHWVNKQLSEETLRTFLQAFSKKYHPHFLFLWGSQAERELVEQLSRFFPEQSTILEKISLPILQNVMTSVELVIAMDSLPLHLAGTTNTPSYALFGPSSATKYNPLGNAHHAHQGSCPYGQHFEKRCKLLRSCKTGACMKNLEGEQLFSHFERWWKKRNVCVEYE